MTGLPLFSGLKAAWKFLVEVGTDNFISLPRWYVLGENGSAVVEAGTCPERL